MNHILVITTGGTIASSAQEGALTPTLSGAELVSLVPEIEGICTVSVQELMNIDSTNMQPKRWIDIARAIQENYNAYDGFVVLHGTDTMAYTSAALSYLIQNSPKPIVLTGSQKPIQSPFTDAKLNAFQSLVYASDPESCDVSIVFSGSAIAGTRARKQRTMSHNAFQSINFPNLALVRNARVVRPGSVFVNKEANPLFYNKLNERVCCIKLTPGIKPDIFALLAKDYDAVILETFGIGGIPKIGPEGASFKHAIDEWCQQGKIIVLTTQVPEEGCDMGVYEVGRVYKDHPGVFLGEDMTTEALIAKTMWVLAHATSREDMKELFYKPINFDRLGV